MEKGKKKIRGAIAVKMKKVIIMMLLPLVSAYHPGTSGQKAPVVVSDPSGPLIFAVIFVMLIIGLFFWKVKNGN